jgi:DNA-binding response OmpR family regulator
MGLRRLVEVGVKPAGRPTAACVVIVEDETATRQLFASALREAGFRVIEAADAFACRAALKRDLADMVVLDLGLPGGVDGMALAAELKDRPGLGLMVVSRRAEPEARIEALDLGVDDFMTKPVHLGELTARVRSVLRRRRPSSSGPRQVGRWSVDLERRTAIGGEEDAGLTRGEFDLLACLLEAEGKIVSRDELLWSISRTPEDADIRTVDVLISRLRRKLDPAGGPSLIVTAPGFGYRLAPVPAA